MTGTRLAAGALAGAVLLAGCSSSSDTTSGTSSSQPQQKRTLTVLAASSLTESFTALKKTLEANDPGLEVKLSFGASSTLVTQLNNGFDADIVALADEKSATSLKATGISHRLFATNRLQIATPAANPGHVTSLKTLSSGSVDTVLCAVQVPCGRAADAVLKKAGVKAHVISYEANVKATLAKVSLGDADAAIVYVTDVKAAGSKVHGVDIPVAENTITKLPIYDLSGSDAAKEFYAAVGSAAFAKVLKDAGFGTP
ncbi:molybdate ABC transporter substrate-binding protein [Calidifontibacter terrae]